MTGEEKLRRQCLITITRAQTEASSVQDISPGQVIISTTGENMYLVCKGLADRRINVRGGLFILTLPTPCRINGRGWTMTGLAHRSVQSTVSLPDISIKPFRLATTITQRSVERHLNGHHWEILSKIEDIKISSLDVDPNEDSGIIWGVSYTVHNIDNRGDPHPRYCRNTNNRDELSEKPTNATPTKRGTKREKKES